MHGKQTGIETNKRIQSFALMCSKFFAVGVAFGSFIVRRFPLKEACKRSALFVAVTRILGMCIALAFLVPGCRTVELAGMDKAYSKM